MMERRIFLAGMSTAMAGTAVFSPYGPLTDAHNRAQTSTRELLADWLGAELRVYDADGRFVDSAHLSTIEEGPCCAGLEQFSAVFETTRGETLPERIFRFVHPAGDAMDIGLTPLGSRSRRYRAIFNLLASA